MQKTDCEKTKAKEAEYQARCEILLKKLEGSLKADLQRIDKATLKDLLQETLKNRIFVRFNEDLSCEFFDFDEH